MNDVSSPNWNDLIHLDRQDRPAVEREVASPSRHRQRARRRWGGRFFTLGGVLALAGGLSLGAWGHYSQQRQTMATAQQERDFVPSLRVATVEASPGVMSVTLPGTTAAFTDANIYARATGYIATRKVDIGDRVKHGELLAQLAVPELDDQISQNEGTLAQLKSALEQAQANQKLAGDLGPLPATGSRRLGDPAAGHRRRPDRESGRRRGLRRPE